MPTARRRYGSRTPGPVTVSIAAFGAVPHDTMVKRSGAKVGDRIVATGTIGDAALGFSCARDPMLQRAGGLIRACASTCATAIVCRGRATQSPRSCARFASAAMDVSDGLAGDLAKLCRASGVSATIDVARVPLSAAARAAVRRDASLIEPDRSPAATTTRSSQPFHRRNSTRFAQRQRHLTSISARSVKSPWVTTRRALSDEMANPSNLHGRRSAISDRLESEAGGDMDDRTRVVPPAGTPAAPMTRPAGVSAIADCAPPPLSDRLLSASARALGAFPSSASMRPMAAPARMAGLRAMRRRSTRSSSCRVTASTTAPATWRSSCSAAATPRRSASRPWGCRASCGRAPKNTWRKRRSVPAFPTRPEQWRARRSKSSPSLPATCCGSSSTASLRTITATASIW